MSRVYRAGPRVWWQEREGRKMQDWNVTKYKYEVLLHLYTLLQLRGEVNTQHIQRPFYFIKRLVKFRLYCSIATFTSGLNTCMTFKEEEVLFLCFSSSQTSDVSVQLVKSAEASRSQTNQ